MCLFYCGWGGKNIKKPLKPTGTLKPMALTGTIDRSQGASSSVASFIFGGGAPTPARNGSDHPRRDGPNSCYSWSQSGKPSGLPSGKLT